MKFFNKKIISSFLVALLVSSVTLSFVSPVKEAQAIPVEEVGPVAGVLIPGIPTIAGGIGVPGTGAAAVSAARATVGATCTTIITALDAADAAENLSTLLDTSSSAAFNIIGGGAVEATKLSGKIVKATAAKECVDGYVLALSNTPGVNLVITQELAREQDKYTKISNSLRTVLEGLKAQQSASVKDILKAFMVKLVLNLNKNLTTSLVNKMVEKYKISDYLAYGDALSTQVYSMKYINDNFEGDARQQMIIRSLLQSDKLPEKAKTAQAFATSKAQEYLAGACGVDGSNSATGQDLNSYIKCMAAYGSPEANPQYHMLQGMDQASAARASGQLNANNEISQSNGFAPPRNCQGTLSAQKDIDTQYDKVALDLRVATLAKESLGNALKMNPPRTTDAEYQKAVAAEAQAKANEQSIKSQINKPIIDICEAIDTPASFVSTSIGDFLKQHLDQTSQLKSDNLPFYASFLSDVASNFLTNILTGGKSTSQVLKEAGTGALASAAGIAGTLPVGGIGSSGIPAPNAAPSIYAVEINGTRQTTELVAGRQYNLVVDFNNIKSSNPTKVFIEFFGATGLMGKTLTAAELQEGKVRYLFIAPAESFRVDATFSKTENNADTVLGTWSESFTIGSVNGASIILPRGPETSFR